MYGALELVCALLGMAGTAHKTSACDTHRPDAHAVAVVDTAIARAGGDSALRAIHTVRYDMVTQWLSTSYDARPFQDAPGYEMHRDLRNAVA